MTRFITVVWKQNHNISKVFLYLKIIKVAEQILKFGCEFTTFL